MESVVIICDQSPIGKNSAEEAIRIGAGLFAVGETINCQLVFTGDAVYALNKNMEPSNVGFDSLDNTIELADLSELELCVLDCALEDAGLGIDDLVEYENLKVISSEDLVDLIEKADTCFRY